MNIQAQEIKSSQASKDYSLSLFNYISFSLCSVDWFSLFTNVFCTLFIFPDKFSLQLAMTSHYAYSGPKSTWPFFSRASSHSVKQT